MIQLEADRQALELISRRYGVSRLQSFGSAVSGDAFSDDSDLDFLVEFSQPEQAGYANRYFGLQKDLEALFGRHVDLVVTSAIKNPYFRESVEKTKDLVDAR